MILYDHPDGDIVQIAIVHHQVFDADDPGVIRPIKVVDIGIPGFEVRPRIDQRRDLALSALCSGVIDDQLPHLSVAHPHQGRQVVMPVICQYADVYAFGQHGLSDHRRKDIAAGRIFRVLCAVIRFHEVPVPGYERQHRLQRDDPDIVHGKDPGLFAEIVRQGQVIHLWPGTGEDQELPVEDLFFGQQRFAGALLGDDIRAMELFVLHDKVPYRRRLLAGERPVTIELERGLAGQDIDGFFSGDMIGDAAGVRIGERDGIIAFRRHRRRRDLA